MPKVNHRNTAHIRQMALIEQQDIAREACSTGEASNALVCCALGSESLSEPELHAIITRYLMTDTQNSAMFKHRLSLSNLLSGGWNGEQEAFVDEMFQAWNAQLGIVRFAVNGQGLGMPANSVEPLS